MILRRAVRPGEAALAVALLPWERQLTLESVKRWLLRGAIGAAALASLALLVGWVVPQPESDLRPWAFVLAVTSLVIGLVVAIWPRPHLRRAVELDRRLRLGDRLVTAWSFRDSERPIVEIQRDDAVRQLQSRSPQSDLRWRPNRVELGALGAVTLLAVLLLITPSPQQAVLDQQAADQLAVQQASQRLEVLHEQAVAAQSLTPDQARQLDELLRQAQEQLAQTRTQQEAGAVVARAQDQIAQQLADPNADLRDEALAAMSETLAAEPQTQALANALQREDAQAASAAIKTLAAQADRLSDVERQALSRALQRAANVGRSDQRSATALRNAAQAIASASATDGALSETDAALSDAINASQAQASLNSTLQRLRDLQTQLASGAPLNPDTSTRSSEAGASTGLSGTPAAGTPVALDSSGSRTLRDPSASQQGGGAGVGGIDTYGLGQGPPGGPRAAENVFVPGRPSTGAADAQNVVDQPFDVRGAPRPYRDVLTQYAQSSRDYVDRPDISPAVRDIVKQYFQSLEEGQ